MNEIQAACSVMGLLIMIVGVVISLFVANRIGKSERTILEAVHSNYLPREIAMAMFKNVDDRHVAHLERCHPRSE